MQKEKHMAFLHCHSCGWEQDDFWDANGYHPFRQDILGNLIKHMIDGVNGRRAVIMDISFAKDIEIPYKKIAGRSSVEVDFRDYLVWELGRIAHKIKKMCWVTDDDFRNAPNKLCPSCGSDNLDID